MATKGMKEGRGNYLVNSDTQIAYKIVSQDPIGRASCNIPVYKVAYSIPDDKSKERRFAYHEFVSLKKVNYRESNSILPFAKLYKEIYTRNNALPLNCHKNLMSMETHFVDEESEDVCVVMPFAERGSLRSIMADAFPYGFPEECISVALRSVVKALCYLHKAMIVHTDVNAGHVYVKNGPQIIVGFAATVYEHGVFNVECSSHRALPAAKISNWGAAPEVYNENQHYSDKADIWLVGITALELAYGGIRVPNREALEVLIREIIKTKRLPKNYQLEEVRKEETKEEKEEDGKGKKIMQKNNERVGSEGRSFSREFEKMVAECLAWKPEERPTAATLLKHDFFRKKGLKKSILRSHFQQVVINKMNSSSPSSSPPPLLPLGDKSLYFESKPDSWIICCMHALLRRPKSHISIPGHESSFDEVMFPKIDSFDLNFPARSYYEGLVEAPLTWRFKRSKRVKRNLFDDLLLSDPEGGREDRNVDQNLVWDEALWEIKVDRRERNGQHPEFGANMGDEALWEVKVEGIEDSSKAAIEGGADPERRDRNVQHPEFDQSTGDEGREDS